MARDSTLAEAIKLTALTHQSLIWDRTRHLLHLRSALREFFPAALKAFPDLDAPDALELLRRAPDPNQAARPTKAGISAALTRANRRSIAAKASELQAILGAQELRQPPATQAACAAIVSSQVALLEALNTQIEQLGEVVAAHFGRHPDAEIYASLPGLGTITRASGTKRIVLARYARNRRLGDTLQQWAFCSLRGSPGAHAYNQQLRGRNIGHQAALRQLANRLVGILHRCLKTHTPYDEHTAWAHHHSGRLTPKNLGCLPRWARPGHPR